MVVMTQGTCLLCGCVVVVDLVIKISGQLSPESLTKVHIDVCGARCSVCGRSVIKVDDVVVDRLVHLLQGDCTLNKAAADKANKEIAKLGKAYALALKDKVFAENDRGIIRCRASTAAFSAMAKPSEAGAERESRACKEYEDACARLATAEYACSEACTMLQVATNDFAIAMASEK